MGTPGKTVVFNVTVVFNALSCWCWKVLFIFLRYKNFNLWIFEMITLSWINVCTTYFAGTSRQTRWPRYFARVLWRERNRSGMTKIMLKAVEEWEFDDSVAFQLCNQIAGEMSAKLAHLSCKHYLVCAFRGSQLQLITFQ